MNGTRRKQFAVAAAVAFLAAFAFVRLVLLSSPSPALAEPSPGSAWVTPFVQDGQSPNEYSFLSILNTSSSSDAVTVSFYSKNGTKITDVSRSVAAGEAWQLFTGSAGGVAGTTGMDGWLEITGSGTGLAPFGAVVLPNEGNYFMVRMPFYRIETGAPPEPTPTLTPIPTPTPLLLSTIFPAGWNMFSLPLVPTDPDFASILGDDISPLYVYGYNPGIGGYQMWSTDNHAFDAEPGKGYWTKVTTNTTVDAQGTLAPNAPFVISLEPGWHQVGPPFNYPVDCGNVQVRNMATGETVSIVEAHSRGWVMAFLYEYDPSVGGYRMYTAPEGQLNAWRAYWVMALVASELVIPNAP